MRVLRTLRQIAAFMGGGDPELCDCGAFWNSMDDIGRCEKCGGQICPECTEYRHGKKLCRPCATGKGTALFKAPEEDLSLLED